MGAAALSLPQRSVSEGALLRYASTAVEEMTWAVRTKLGVDVSNSKATRRMMRKSSFVAGLDVGRVSFDPHDPSTATAQAVKNILGKEPKQKRSSQLSSI